jgi:hypothetical protein
MDLFGFIQWCFRSSNSTILTIIVGVLLGELLIRLAVALRGRK